MAAKFISVLVILGCVTVQQSWSAKLAEDIPKCNYGDDGCIAKSTEYVLNNYFAGAQAMGILPMDPIEINEVSILEDKNSKQKKPISLDLWFKNWKLHGLKDMQVKKVTGFERDMKGKIRLEADIPKINLLGHYKVKGQILVLPIQGEGNSNLTLVDNKLFVLVSGDFVERNGKRYLHLQDKPKIDLRTNRLYIQLDNLFNGNKQLGDTMNSFMNENWRELYNELKQGIFDALGAVIVNLVNNIFIRIPYDQLFADGSPSPQPT